VPRRRLTRVVLGLAIALVLVVGGFGVAVAAGWLLHDTAKPASVSKAVARLHTSGAKGAIYFYATRGGESLNAFVSARHVYPARTAVTVVPVDCGRRLSWDALEGRSTTWTLCRTPRGLELRSEVETHSFFARKDLTAYDCTGAVLSGDRSFLCRSRRGTANGRIHDFGREELMVGGRELPALHVQTVSRVRGGDGGTETMDWWLEPKTGLPLRLSFRSKTSRPLRIGNAHYREQADLRLVSTTPRR
jgi:hypothetical protein